ncbi:MAG: NRDE family protein [Flavobacterium sp.]|nr:NRDE family protein [Flavobacterium sp.]
MCTVSFVKANDKIIITSNRDEQVLREPAIEPQSYTVNDKKLIFPKDPKAGGTWYAIDETGNVLVLLNGASEKHEVKLPYRKSRGLIVLDIISGDSPLKMWQDIDLDNIEPFTLVLFEMRKLYQLRWNGIQKEMVQLDPEQNHIWSSSTLYPKEVRDARQEWFYNFLDTKPEISAVEMYNFHRYTEEGNAQNGLVINRNDAMKTLSITQTVIEKKKVLMSHYDLIREHEFANSFSL